MIYPGGAYTAGSSQTPISAADAYVIYDGSALRAADVGSSPPNTFDFSMGAGALPMVFVNPSDDGVLFVSNEASSSAFASVPSVVNYTGTAPAPVRFVITLGTNATGPFGGVRNLRTGQGIYFTGLTIQVNETLYIETSAGKARVYSDQRGSLIQYVSPGSDLGIFVLLEGANPITILWGPYASSQHIVWMNKHAGIDGAGSNIVSA
jgi:hypothetical protein